MINAKQRIRTAYSPPGMSLRNGNQIQKDAVKISRVPKIKESINITSTYDDYAHLFNTTALFTTNFFLKDKQWTKNNCIWKSWHICAMLFIRNGLNCGQIHEFSIINILAHDTLAVHEFSALERGTLINHPPCSPDQVPCNCCLFPKLKIVSGQRFQSISDHQRIEQWTKFCILIMKV